MKLKPGDDEIREALNTKPVYRRFPRGRLRMFLEAIEDHYRSETGQPQVERRGYPIEHILPQAWTDTWPAKRAALLQHNTMTLTGRVVNSTEHADWDETLIDQRSAEMIGALLDIWPVPEGHLGKVVDPQTKPNASVELKDLIEAGLLAAGDVLVPNNSEFRGEQAVLAADGSILLNGQRYASLSAAGRALRKKVTTGWSFWRLSDGRRLRHVRAEFEELKREAGE